MSIFDEWHRRHLAADPQAPTSPPPFKVGERVIIATTDADSMFINGVGGIVTSVDYAPDPEDVFGPWQVGVLVDPPIGLQMAFSSSELRHPEEGTEDFAADAVAPTIPFREDVSATPIYDALRSCAEFGNQVEADLKALTERNRR